MSWLEIWSGAARDAALSGLVLFALAAAVAALLRRRSAAARHMVWLLFLAALLALPAVSTLAPRWHVPVVQGPRSKVQSRTPEVQSPKPTVQSEGTSISAMARGAEAQGPGPKAQGLPTAQGLPVAEAAFLLWAGGALVLLLRLLRSVAQLRTISRDSRPACEEHLLEAASDAARLMGLSGPPELRLQGSSAAALGPMTWGSRRPVVLLPAAAAGWPAERLRFVLLHELGHVARSDWAAGLLADLCCALYWCHPAVWYAARRLRMEAERACDDLVLRNHAAPAAYALDLLEILKALRAPLTPRSVMNMASSLNPFDRSQIEERLNAILDEHTPRTTLDRKRRLVAAAAAAALLLPLAALSYGAAPPASAKKAVQPGLLGTSASVPMANRGRGELEVRLQRLRKASAQQKAVIAILERRLVTLRAQTKPSREIPAETDGHRNVAKELTAWNQRLTASQQAIAQGERALDQPAPLIPASLETLGDALPEVESRLAELRSRSEEYLTARLAAARRDAIQQRLNEQRVKAGGADATASRLRAELARVKAQLDSEQERTRSARELQEAELSVSRKELELLDRKLAELRIELLTRPEGEAPELRQRLRELEAEEERLRTIYSAGAPQLAKLEAQMQSLKRAAEQDAKVRQVEQQMIAQRMEARRQALLVLLAQSREADAKRSARVRELQERAKLLEQRLLELRRPPGR
jgi:beta-lactamase regulating signal transducer with metallopeptidase domain